jgi:hypothetical protein
MEENSKKKKKELSPGTHRIGGRVGSRAGLDAVEKGHFLDAKELELRRLSRPARSQSLYRLRYHGSLYVGSVPLLRRLVAVFPRWRPGLQPRSEHVGFVVDKSALGQVFSEYVGFPCQSFN